MLKQPKKSSWKATWKRKCRYLKKIDIFGRQVSLLYEQERNFKTYCGFSATMVLILALLIFAFKELSKVFCGEVKNFSYYVANNHPYMERNLRPKNGTFGRILEGGRWTGNKKRVQMYERFYNKGVKFAYFFENLEHRDGSALFLDHSGFKFSRINCNEVSLPKSMKSAPSGITCGKLSTRSLQKTDMILRVKKCIKRQKCLQTSKIDKILLKGSLEAPPVKLIMLLEVNNNDIGKLEASVKTKMKRLEFAITPEFSTKNTIRMMQYQLTTSDSILFKNEDFNSLVLHHNEERLWRLHPAEQLKEIRITLEKEKKIFVKKSLYRLTDFLSLFGGMIKGSSLIMFVLYWPIRELLYYRKLINEMFIVCSDQAEFKNLVKNTVERADQNKGRKPGKRACTSKILLEKKKTKERLAFAKQLLKDKEDNTEIKILVDRVMDIKSHFHRKGLFHNIMNNQVPAKKKKKGMLGRHRSGIMFRSKSKKKQSIRQKISMRDLGFGSAAWMQALSSNSSRHQSPMKMLSKAPESIAEAPDGSESGETSFESDDEVSNFEEYIKWNKSASKIEERRRGPGGANDPNQSVLVTEERGLVETPRPSSIDDLAKQAGEGGPKAPVVMVGGVVRASLFKKKPSEVGGGEGILKSDSGSEGKDEHNVGSRGGKGAQMMARKWSESNKSSKKYKTFTSSSNEVRDDRLRFYNKKEEVRIACTCLDPDEIDFSKKNGSLAKISNSDLLPKKGASAQVEDHGEQARESPEPFEVDFEENYRSVNPVYLQRGLKTKGLVKGRAAMRPRLMNLSKMPLDLENLRTVEMDDFTENLESKVKSKNRAPTNPPSGTINAIRSRNQPRALHRLKKIKKKDLTQKTKKLKKPKILAKKFQKSTKNHLNAPIRSSSQAEAQKNCQRNPNFSLQFNSSSPKKRALNWTLEQHGEFLEDVEEVQTLCKQITGSRRNHQHQFIINKNINYNFNSTNVGNINFNNQLPGIGLDVKGLEAPQELVRIGSSPENSKKVGTHDLKSFDEVGGSNSCFTPKFEGIKVPGKGQGFEKMVKSVKNGDSDSGRLGISQLSESVDSDLSGIKEYSKADEAQKVDQKTPKLPNLKKLEKHDFAEKKSGSPRRSSISSPIRPPSNFLKTIPPESKKHPKFRFSIFRRLSTEKANEIENEISANLKEIKSRSQSAMDSKSSQNDSNSGQKKLPKITITGSSCSKNNLNTKEILSKSNLVSESSAENSEKSQNSQNSKKLKKQLTAPGKDNPRVKLQVPRRRRQGIRLKKVKSDILMDKIKKREERDKVWLRVKNKLLMVNTIKELLDAQRKSINLREERKVQLSFLDFLKFYMPWHQGPKKRIFKKVRSLKLVKNGHKK